mmetsp:Transcript_12116/g.36302  ORF Transcript_12116/g.36302 Transcript_12116/m.36302 type:complete len:213 (+) Transcript_12116:316-954(+)
MSASTRPLSSACVWPKVTGDCWCPCRPRLVLWPGVVACRHGLALAPAGLHEDSVSATASTRRFAEAEGCRRSCRAWPRGGGEASRPRSRCCHCLPRSGGLRDGRWPACWRSSPGSRCTARLSREREERRGPERERGVRTGRECLGGSDRPSRHDRCLRLSRLALLLSWRRQLAAGEAGRCRDVACFARAREFRLAKAGSLSPTRAPEHSDCG